MPPTPLQVYDDSDGDLSSESPKPKKEKIQRSITANTWNIEQKQKFKRKKRSSKNNDIIVSDHIRKFNLERRRSDDLSHSLLSRTSEADNSLYSRILEVFACINLMKYVRKCECVSTTKGYKE